MNIKQTFATLVLALTMTMSACAQQPSQKTEQAVTDTEKVAETSSKTGTVMVINQDEFAEKLCDWHGDEWIYKSSRPAVVDFNATWCGPCRQLAPILKELAIEMPEVDFYSIDVDENRPMAKAFGVSSIPMLLICPLKGDPTVLVGLHPKEEIVKAINQVISGEKSE